jgi:drug/metabolite transporter superfamily protein YnfA
MEIFLAVMLLLGGFVYILWNRDKRHAWLIALIFILFLALFGAIIFIVRQRIIL